MEQLGPCQLHLGDSKDLRPTADALITDPPYGAANDCDYTRFVGGLSPSRNYHKGIAGDDQPFDPSPWLSYPKIVLFGYQFFAQHLPPGSVFVWNKKRPNQLGTFLSDAELAWHNRGKGVYIYSHVWHGFDRESQRGQKSLHPSEKPVALFEWLIDRLKLEPGQTVFDPFMGSGPCGVACIRKGLNYVGAELEPTYYEIAKARIEKELDARS